MLAGFFKSLLNKLDLSYGLVLKHRTVFLVVLGVTVCAVVVTGLLKLRKRLERSKSVANVIKYLMTSSARHVKAAVELQKSNPIESLEHAVYGVALATTAKDLTGDKDEFANELEVDVFAYLDYTNKVLNEVKRSVTGA